MMWMMVICCALPFLALLLGGRSAFSGGYLLPVLVGILILVHLGMMFRGHASGTAGKSKPDDGHTQDGSCH